MSRMASVLLLAIIPLSGMLYGESIRKAYKVYLAGPDVFLPNSEQKAANKRAIIDKFNKEVLQDANFKFVAIDPTDLEIDDFKYDQATAMKIFRANIEFMQNADFVIANMTRFRGPSMDVGTAFEMGYMYGLGKPVFGYYNIAQTYCTADQIAKTAFECAGNDSNTHTSYVEKVKKFGNGYFIDPTTSDHKRDKFTHKIEKWGLSDNLMMVGAARNLSGEKIGYAMAGSFLAALHEAAAVFHSRHNKKDK